MSEDADTSPSGLAGPSPHWKWVLLVGLALVIGIPLLDAIFSFGLGVVWNGYVESVRAATGLNRYLVDMISSLLFIPFGLGVKWSLSLRRSDRNKGLVTLAGMLAIYYGALYLATRDQNFDRESGASTRYWCKGEEMYDQPGIDPVFGCELRPLTPDEIGRRLAVTGAEPNPMTAEDTLFDRATGETRAWYSRNSTGQIQAWDQPGYTRTGDELQPVTRDIAREMARQEAIEKAAREKAQQEAKQGREAEARVERADRDRRQRESNKKLAARRRATEKLRTRYEEVMQRAHRETAFWDEWAVSMAEDGLTFRPQITSALDSAKSKMKRCTELIRNNEPVALTGCLITLSRNVNDLESMH